MTCIDKIVKFWDKQPCNIKHSQKPIGTKEYFNEVSKKRYFVESHIHQFVNFKKWQGKQVLEIGCGIGTDAEEFVKHGAEYVGIDISKKSIKIAKEKFLVLDLLGKFYQINAADSEKMESLGKFDLVYSYGVLHHSPNVETIIDNVYNSLKDNGTFLFMVYAKNSWKHAMIQAKLDQYEAQDDCPYAVTFTVDEINLLLKNKFNIVNIEQDHCFMFNVEKYKNNEYELEPWFAEMPDEMRSAIKKYLGWHLLVTATKRQDKG